MDEFTVPNTFSPCFTGDNDAGSIFMSRYHNYPISSGVNNFKFLQLHEKTYVDNYFVYKAYKYKRDHVSFVYSFITCKSFRM